MSGWTCNTCGPVPAEEICLLDHDSPHGQELHECGSGVVFDDWGTPTNEGATA